MGFLDFLNPVSAGVNIAGDIVGGIQRNRALQRAEQLQLNAIGQSRGTIGQGLAAETGTYQGGQQQGYEAALGGLGGLEQTNQPYEQAGRNALYSLGGQDFNAIPFQGPNQFNFDISKVGSDPAFQQNLNFTLGEAMKAYSRSAAGRGAIGSGGTQQELLKYATGLAGQQYNQAFGQAFDVAQQNYQNQRQGALDIFGAAQENQANRFNRLFSLGGLGQRSATQTAGAQQQFGRDVLGLDEATAARIAASQGQAYGNLSNLDLAEGGVRAGRTLGAAENVLGATRNTLYDLNQFGQGLRSRRGGGPAPYAPPQLPYYS